ncbi:protein FRA10AC1 [Sesamum alatum]|uniref:Protein FRA10AC1 n=1 Tax=Sesamum alatum TaxID=300844 RepID=A0AAE1YEQ7_9LAMI|nr:protein FRA10AC1 [Sesamum alatum]
MGSFGSLKQAIFDKEERKQQYQDHIRGLNAYDRHKNFLNDYVGYYGKEKSARETLPVKTDQDTLREGYRFIRTEEDDMTPSWEQRLVKRYYDKLFKEYCIADMSQYKTGKIGLRWRTEKEVISGKGQFVCGNKHCNEKDGLSSYEVNFSYFEAGERKQALVKLVACERCAEKLYFKKQKEKEQLRRKENEKHQRKRDRSESEDDEDIDYGRSKERRKGNKASTSATDNKKMGDNDENFEEFLEGMFP